MNIDIKEIFTLPTSALCALSIGLGVTLFAPSQFLEKMHLLDKVDKYGFYIGIAFILISSIVLVNIIINATKAYSNMRNKREFYVKAEDRLRSLSSYQKAILYALYEQYDNTLPLKLHNGAIEELKAKFCIGYATQQYAVENLNEARFPFLLQPWVKEEMSKKPHLINEFKNDYYIHKHLI
ncbi:hypothetical protein FC605_11785 [Bacillus subtilis]|uniref:super-infection exclusion protein B n=1 Tax=Bacillus subtilis TaxID=1423 RepID=UPI0009B5EFF4|nr:super-infection exclusion protein B [Bacillus subtilis]ARB37570.1 hypothetical protein BSK2_11710 [Bacillus subtilis]QCU15485.1 hypothetical protein FC605_11785 [Bacillus subtilis]